jgi:hypothetical protein
MTKQLVVGAAIAAAILAAQPALADNSVARLTDVSGNVLVSNDFNIASAGEALRLTPGMRVLVTMNSAATVVYDDGCRVPVAAGERFEIRAGMACGERRARHRPAPSQVAAVVR